jgi:hypothetical protein
LAWSCNGSFFLKSSEGVTMLFFDPKLYHIRHISGLGILKLYHIRHTSGLGPGLGSLKYTILRNLALARTTNQFGVACITYCTTENLMLPQLLARRNAGCRISMWVAETPLRHPLTDGWQRLGSTTISRERWRLRDGDMPQLTRRHLG